MMIVMNNNFISKSSNVYNLDPEVEGLPIVLETKKDIKFDTVLSNSFGFGGTNAALIFKKFDIQNNNFNKKNTLDKKQDLLFEGKKGIVFGIANDHSCAWGIAEDLLKNGAELCLTYQNETLFKRVQPLAEELDSDLLIECDFSKTESITGETAVLDFKLAILKIDGKKVIYRTG